MDEWLNNLLAFVAVVLEFILGSAVFFAIVYIAHILEVAINSLHDPKGSMVYWVSQCGEIFLLCADSVIGIFFVTRGIRNAWQATWGT
jgi:hypothetical protein